MKTQSSYFRRKNSKQGLALSTAMAICIVLAILVAVLVSMASLNITTTQATISQREAYIQAKSALAFAESYYSQHDIPGKEESAGGAALIVFNDSVVSNGAKVYVTQEGATSLGVNTDELKEKCLSTYVDVLHSGDYLDLTAHCKYGDDNYYELSREFSLGGDYEIRPNSFTGNVSYQATSDTRYLRIHVRTNPAFDGYPFLYTWYTNVNKDTDDFQYGRSSIVNKMSEDKKYATVSNGLWGSSGPEGDCAMTYEGNGWYVTEVKIPTGTNVNFVNAIVTKDNAHRTKSGGGYNTNQQSWEFFGIPVPSDEKTGESNGLDVYITLNRNELRDAVNSGSNDELTQFYKTAGSVNNFAKFCGSWYTIYTKKDTSTMHYRKIGVYDDSAGPGGSFEYEGYGWWRCTSNNFSDTVAGYSFGSANTISQNEYGQEIVKEGFIADFGDGNVKLYASEADANDDFAAAGDAKAGDYLTVSVKASKQPVNDTVETKIKYSSKWDTSEGSSTDADPAPDTDTPVDTDVAYSTKDNLNVEKLASTAWEKEYALIGSMNNWARNADESDHLYDNLRSYKFTKTGDNLYEIYIKDCAADTYTFKVIEMKSDTGSIDSTGGWDFAYGGGQDRDGNSVKTIENTGNTLHVVFNASSNSITATEENPDEPVDGSQKYAVIGWLNDWGTKKDGTTYTTACFEATDDMTFNEESGIYRYVTDVEHSVVSNTEYQFKIIHKTSDSGVIGGDAEYYGDGVNNVVFKPPYSDGEIATYKAVITFDSRRKNIEVNFEPTGVAGEQFYLIGNYNNWGNNHTFNKATSSLYELESTGTTDLKGRYLYKLTPTDALEAGEYEVKVISSKSLKSGVDGDSEDSIDYNISWGEADSSKTTYGLTKNDGTETRLGLKFTLSKRTKVEFTFAYDPSSFVTSPITYVPVTTEDVSSITVKFYNAKSKDEDNNPTDFETPWKELYLTYTKATGLPKCVKIDFSEGTKNISCSIPEDVKEFYFSNMNSTTSRDDPDYQCTQKIEFKKSLAGKTLRPTHLAADSNAPSGKSWLLTYQSSRDVDDISGEGTMVYSGSSQNNYYDAPLVKVLNMIVSHGSADGGGTKYAFAAYPYKGFSVSGVGSLTFNASNKITYQGETYYYIAGKSYEGGSFLIVQDSGKTKGGILREDDMALANPPYSYNVQTNMDNRGGGVFTSDETYYDGSHSWHNYGGYTPNWYTYKVPVTTDLKIEYIKGVTSSGTDIINGVDYFTPANVTDNYKQPLYVVQEYKNTSGEDQIERFYTYNTNIGNVDTNTSNKVSVYFANNGSGDSHFDKVSVYAYDPLGNSTTQELSIDGTDADHNYYIYTFDSGAYCYFQFYDPTTGDENSATKKTGILYLTGNEDPVTREYDILALNGDSTTFVPYIHPRTQALFAAISLESAASAARIPGSYSYNPKTGDYTTLSTLSMSALDSKATAARNYANNGSGGKWSATDPSANMGLASTVQEFVRTVLNARIYIADDVPEADPSSTDSAITGDNIFKEGSYRDDTFKYQERWVNLLTSYYNTAIGVYGNESQQTNASYLQGCINDMNSLIASPLTDWNTDAVQIIVDDQIDKSGNGGWGKSNIHLYTCDDSGNNWKLVNYDLYDTTQSGFYAYVFKLKLSTDNYYVGKSLPEDGSPFMTLQKGRQYIYHTASDKFEKDNSILTYKVANEEIKADSSTGAYNTFDTRTGDKAFILYFQYDTKVTYSGGSYTIHAGSYTISATYPGYTKDLPGDKNGIDLFTENAKKFFTNPVNYGMSDSSTTSYTTWDEDKLDSGTNIDLMINKIDKSSQISATTSTNKKIGFRYKATKGDDTLKLKQKVSLEGGTVTVAVNKLDLGTYDMTIKAKTIIFLTDTTVVTSHGEVQVPHGTYSFNEAESGTDYTVSLQETGGTPDWRDHYTLISETPSKLKGGYYVEHSHE